MSEQNMLDGKVVVVTGAGRGIGRAIAIMAASRGARVVVNDLGGTEQGDGADQIPALEVVKAITDAGGEAIANFGNVANADDAGQMIEDARSNFGRIDCVVNNAGILRDVIFHKMTEEQFDSVISVHLKGSFNVSRAAAPYFREQSSGSMVHMTSTSGLIGNFGQANYAAAKLGIAGLSRSIALDMSRFGVRSNCISPFAWSRLIGTIPQSTDAERERVKKIQQMTPEKIAPLAVYLLSDQASDITGQIFVVRNNEICLMSQPRPIRNLQTSEGWTPETVSARVGPAIQSSLVPLERSGDVFNWDPV
ncbi:3-hydroxyacyl-CoA dehydrogenase [Sneathiella chinensis]|uniref:3-hydroxyacyl-CoA dehydrogenase n=2 Tax=Sneathiella chinensis TaxID=349750 RepID=A0ABQ5U605_9PROT|nr:SDR family oxidoreductase [Sneathiella chinensis]GLQ06747.1 3-hydroxyacyl-CoA dehydrogenase [Sneathiella chinensis]